MTGNIFDFLCRAGKTKCYKNPLIPCNPVPVCPKRNDEEGAEVTSASLEWLYELVN